jgi:hypothetical protein
VALLESLRADRGEAYRPAPHLVAEAGRTG